MSKIPEYDKAFNSYKLSIPVAGGILMNESMTKVVRVRQPKGNNYGFPKVKLNKDEDTKYGCVREVKEETGYVFPVSKCIKEYSFEIDPKVNKFNGSHKTVFYVITDVPEDTKFQPMSKEEICEVTWQKIEDLNKTEEKTKILEIVEKIKNNKKKD